MIKLRRCLHHATFITLLCFVLVLIAATLLRYERALSEIYYAPWFKWIFGVLFLGLSATWIIASLYLRDLKTLMVHIGLIIVVVSAVLSGSSIQGTVVLAEGSTCESFDDEVRGRFTFPSPIKLLHFEEEGYVNTVLISGQEYRLSPSHPLEKWGYLFFSYEYDVKWDVKQVVITDSRGQEYTLTPSQTTKFVPPFILKFIGLTVNRKNDTLAEFAVFDAENIKGSLFIGTKGILAPAYGLDLKLTYHDADASYVSTILIKKDPGLRPSFWGFGICFLGFVISFWDKRWMKS